MTTHASFPPITPSLPARQSPHTIPALRQFIDDPESPFVVALVGGLEIAPLVSAWLIPALERLVKNREDAREVLSGGWSRTRGGRGKDVVVIWAVATYFTGEITPQTHPVDLARLTEDTIRTIDPALLRIPSITSKLGDLSNGLLAVAKIHGIVDHALQPLWTLLHKARPASGCLTPVHAPLVEACLLTRNLSVAKTLLDSPITDVTSCPLRYMDYLAFHYLGAQVYIGLQEWKRAREMLRMVVCAPGTSVSAVQIAAHKRLVLVNLIIDGTEPTYPRFLPGNLLSAFATHAPEYAELARAYASLDEARLGGILRKNDTFRRDGTYGLLLHAYEFLPARKLLKMRETYVRISLGSLAQRIGSAFGDVSEDEAEALVMRLVTQGVLFARINHPSEGPATVEFTDDPDPYSSPATVDALGVRAMEMQEMGKKLGGMEQALSVHEAWLKEVIRRDEKRPSEGKAFDAPSKGGEKGNVRGVGSNWADAGF